LCRFRFIPNDIFAAGSTNRPSWRACFANKMKLASLPPSQRQSNLAGAFAVPQDQCHRITNRPVLLIDDVMTTGATLY